MTTYLYRDPEKRRAYMRNKMRERRSEFRFKLGRVIPRMVNEIGSLVRDLVMEADYVRWADDGGRCD